MTDPTPPDPSDVERNTALDASAFRGPGREIARDLLGTLLLVEDAEAAGGSVGGVVVETEAYVDGVDPACHLAAGRTARTEPFFRGAGTLYVYTIHGHDALNVISTYGDHPEGILIRALEPTHARGLMRERRGREDPAELASGPGKLTEALGVSNEEFDGEPLAASRLSLYRTDRSPEAVVSKRVGVTAATDWPLRFTAAESPFVSRAPETTGLDHEAVRRAYERLAAEDGSLPTVDP